MITRKHILHRRKDGDGIITVRSEIGYQVETVVDKRMLDAYGCGAIDNAERTNEHHWQKALYQSITKKLLEVRHDIYMIRTPDDIAAVCRKVDSLISETQWRE